MADEHDEITGKGSDFALTAPNDRAIVKRTKPTLVQFGDRIVPSDGRWHPDLVAEYVRDHGGRRRWIPIGELARVFFAGNVPTNKKRVRRRLYRVFHELLGRNCLLVVEVDEHNAAQACKIYDPRSLEERQCLRERLDRMERQKLLKADQHQKALTLADCLEAAVNDADSVPA
jgi:hypothetical protein